MIPRNPWLTTNATFYYMQGFFFRIKRGSSAKCGSVFQFLAKFKPSMK